MSLFRFDIDARLTIGDLGFRYCDWLPEGEERLGCYRNLVNLDRKASQGILETSGYVEAQRQLRALTKNFCENPTKNLLCYSDVDEWLAFYSLARKLFLNFAEASTQSTLSIDR